MYLREGTEALPYDATQQLLSVMGANGNKIGTVLSVIIPFQPIPISLFQPHTLLPINKESLFKATAKKRLSTCFRI